MTTTSENEQPNATTNIHSHATTIPTRKYVKSTMATTGHNENRDATDPNRTSLSLILQATHQDPAAWERLVSIYSPLVYFWCQESGLSRADLQDVFQEVFHALARNLHKFRPIENGTFRGWLRTLTRNKLNDYFRQSGLEPKPVGGTEALNFLKKIPAATQRQSSSNHSSAVNCEGPLNEQATIELAIVHSTLCQALANVRINFSEQSWKAFWMVVVDGRETVEVAKDLGMLPGTVRVAKSRILKRLRLELGDSLD
jgi:RNA polymerase sigma-70 factor, ECF subfamily